MRVRLLRGCCGCDQGNLHELCGQLPIKMTCSSETFPSPVMYVRDKATLMFSIVVRPGRACGRAASGVLRRPVRRCVAGRHAAGGARRARVRPRVARCLHPGRRGAIPGTLKTPSNPLRAVAGTLLVGRAVRASGRASLVVFILAAMVRSLEPYPNLIQWSSWHAAGRARRARFRLTRHSSSSSWLPWSAL